MIFKGPWKRKKREEVIFVLKGATIKPSRAVKYLGIIFYGNVNFAEHIKFVTKKAERIVASLSRIMPNIGGSQSKNRELLGGVVHSLLLYRTPRWIETLTTRRHKKMFNRNFE